MFESRGSTRSLDSRLHTHSGISSIVQGQHLQGLCGSTMLVFSMMGSTVSSTAIGSELTGFEQLEHEQNPSLIKTAIEGNVVDIYA